jgi:hypothetical protein
VTNEQLYLTIGVPILFNAILITVLFLHMNSRFDGMEKRFGERFDSINSRFDDMRDLWRAELRRVEEILDGRLKHLEEKG